MGRFGCSRRGRGRAKNSAEEDNGFAAWGGYMEAKKAKLLDQFTSTEIKKVSDIFQGVAIHVNGLTKPPADELKNLMAAHGGLFHMYQVSKTTHIIASNLPNVKIKQLGTVPIVKPGWIVDSISLGKLLDYRRYLLYTNQSFTQPRIEFPIIEKPSPNSKEIKPDELVSEQQNESNALKDVSENSATINASTSAVVDRNSEQRKGPTKTAADPKFLEEFYNNSRLHLISTLGAEFKQLVGQMRDKSDGKFPGKGKLIETKGKTTTYVFPNSVIMHIDMDCFFVSVGLRNHPELRGQPVAITHARNGQISNNRPDRKANREQEFALYSDRLPEGTTSRIATLDANSSMSEIASCSYEARKCGIKNGMFMGQAVKLCPGLKTLPYDFEGYREVSHILYKTIASYTLDIEAVSCDEMYVDVTGILKETGLSVEEWATHIRNEIMTITRCPCSTGFGANRLQARLATRKAKPSGQYYLQADDVEMYMAEIPLADLPGVGYATLAKLKNLGLSTCGDVQVASLAVIQSEIGLKAGETLKEQSRGVDKRPLNFHHERKSVSAEVNYGIRFKMVEECYNFLQSLSNEVYSRLNDIGMRARCVTLKLLVRAANAPVETAKFLGCGVCDSLTKSTSNIIINDAQVIYREVKSLYDKLNPPFVDLRGVGIQLTKLEKNAPMNKALSNFLKQAPKKQNETEKSVIPVCNLNNTEVTKDIVENRKVETVKSVPPKLDTSKSSSSRQSMTKSKRGRPRGAKTNSSKQTSKSRPSTPINKFFMKDKGVENRGKVQKQTSVNHQIDLNVLKELPEDLRNEIIKEYGLELKIKESPKSPKVQAPVAPEKARVQVKSNKDAVKIENQANSSMTNKNPFQGLSWDRIKPIIKKWVSSEEKPSEIDVIMIAEHFRQLAIDRDIEVLQSVFNFLHRIFSDLNCDWHKAYFLIVNITQEGMVARYGGTLMVIRRFECCNM